MKQWVLILMLVTLSSMHGVFEAAGSLSIIKNMTASASISSNVDNQAINECCEEDAIELSTVAFHCPLDGKILATGLEISPRSNRQVHFACETSVITTISSTFFFRPPII